MALFGRHSSGGGVKHIRIGIDTPSPTAIASPLRKAGLGEIRMLRSEYCFSKYFNLFRVAIWSDYNFC